MKNNYYKIKSEKGSITLFVLLAMLFFSAILLTAYIKMSNTSISQEEDISRIKEIYEKDIDNIEEVYDRVTIKSEVERVIKSGKQLSLTNNMVLTDEYGNIITLPAGFKITNDATTVNKGIVIEDIQNGNQFVWVPVPADGKVYTNKERTEYKTVELNRYTFDENGIKTNQEENSITSDGDANYYHEELQTTTSGIIVTPAKNIDEFKSSVEKNKGYYIGRYEARTKVERNEEMNTLAEITIKGDDYVYNYITQQQASEKCQNMYDADKTYKSDLINSYAWDTAILFMQECGDNSKYSKQNSINTEILAKKGTNDTTGYTENKDIQCNIYDMASNLSEWTTETCNKSEYNCTIRGGNYQNNTLNSSYRTPNSTTYKDNLVGFRPILYL